MKKCPICGAIIINGENGCAMYKECFKCRPIRYVAPARRPKPEEITGDYESAILARQEENWQD